MGSCCEPLTVVLKENQLALPRLETFVELFTHIMPSQIDPLKLHPLSFQLGLCISPPSVAPVVREGSLGTHSSSFN